MPGLLVNIDVPDLAAAERFYAAAFGLTAGRRLGDHALEMHGAAVPIYLLAKPAGTAASAATADRRRYDRHWCPLHLDVVVEDLAGAIDRALAAGALQEVATQDAPYGRIAMFADPFGHGFCLIQFNEDGYDAIAA